MSTKNLARTVIEGGRGSNSRWMRRASHGTDRTLARQALIAAFRNDDLDELIVPRGDHDNTYFTDKLSPARRWLASQAGRPWDLVRRELFQRFDTRTTAGRHVVHCHLLPWVEREDWSPRSRFHVDARGILRHEVPSWPHRRAFAPLPRSEAELTRWLAGRLVGERGTALFWFVVTPSGAFRQENRLGEEDARLWRSLPPCFRKDHRPFAPRN